MRVLEIMLASDGALILMQSKWLLLEIILGFRSSAVQFFDAFLLSSAFLLCDLRANKWKGYAEYIFLYIGFNLASYIEHCYSLRHVWL